MTLNPDDGNVKCRKTWA